MVVVCIVFCTLRAQVMWFLEDEVLRRHNKSGKPFIASKFWHSCTERRAAIRLRIMR